jgi:DHA1 family bicyclomycin/chloramphenicol resistance-like MFS transporter
MPFDTPRTPLSRAEFVAMMAAVMALNALAIDTMLPAFPQIAASLHVTRANDLQFIVGSFLLAQAFGALVMGPLADRFGRRPVLVGAIIVAALCALGCALVTSFEGLIALRVVHGFFASAMGAISTAVIRDRYSGDAMASLMSMTIIVFMAVPVVAPTLGSAILAVTGWRAIFQMLAFAALLVGLWVLLRLPETLRDEDRLPLSPRQTAATWRFVLTQRLGIGYMLASGIVMGALFGFLNSSPQIFGEVFGAQALFPYAFAAVAGTMALTNFFNSRIVEQFGARRVSHGALLIFILLSIAQIIGATMPHEPMPLFLVIVALNMGMVGFTGANFSAIAMEPFGKVAGAAASFQMFVRMGIASVIGAFTGQRFDGTTLPLAEGFLVCGLLSLGCVLWAEQGRLFTRPRRGALREVRAPR